MSRSQWGPPSSKGQNIIIGIDSGTSVIKAVAFNLAGQQLAIASVPNQYETANGGAVTQSLSRTWTDCAKTMQGLAAKIENLAARTAAIAITGQGDGTWLVGKGNAPVSEAWLWLDARAAPTVDLLAKTALNRGRFEATGTGLNTCQQGSQLAHMDKHFPELVDKAEAALHCKDWIFLNLTGVRATDPSEAGFTFGNFRNRRYDDVVIHALGLKHRRNLLPDIIDGAQTAFPLSAEAALATGLLRGTPVSLGYVDMAMTALGAGVYTDKRGAACSTVGSTGVHMRAVRAEDVVLNAECTGYVIALPIPGIVTQVQTNMAATLNIDWALRLATDAMQAFGMAPTQAELVGHIETWLSQSTPGGLIYHPYISEAGERGPFVNANARADFIGLSMTHHYCDLVRAVLEGLGMAMRDCYTTMGPLPSEVRLTGGATRSKSLRQILSACVKAPVRVSQREEAGAAGAAMMAAVAIGAYPTMDDCIAEWVTPLLGLPESADAALAATYDRLFGAYRDSRRSLVPTWEGLAGLRPTDGNSN